MRNITPIHPEQFRLISENKEGILAHWVTTFKINDLYYNLIFEQFDPIDSGYNYIADSLPINWENAPLSYFIKFDNSLNEAFGRPYKRLDKNLRLSPGNIFILARRIIGGIEIFCQTHAPIILVGIPNDEKLLKLYVKLIDVHSITGYKWQIIKNSYHQRGAICLYR